MQLIEEQTEAIAQFGVNKKANSDIDKLAQAYKETDIHEHLSVLLNKNHLTPADVLGLPKDLENTRKDRFSNSMVKTAFETHFAQKKILSETSIDFIIGSVDSLIQEIDKPKNAPGLLKSIQENSYFKRDIQEILGEKVPGSIGIKAEIPADKATILRALRHLKTVKGVKDQHAKLRMVYLFFHILRPYAQILGNNLANKAPALEHRTKHLKSKEFVNNRTPQLDDYSFLNPQLNSFGILDVPGVKNTNKDMPYDKFKSTHQHTAKSGNEMTAYMQALGMPFIGGVSGTTRDQSQVLDHIFTKETLKNSYWDFQLLNAAFMIGNSYHSFFETIYVAARYDKYTDKGAKILAEFDKAHSGSGGIQIYLNILNLIHMDPDMEENFTKWYKTMAKDKAPVLI